MITTAQCVVRFGDPVMNEAKFMKLVKVDEHTRNAFHDVLPGRIYMNVCMIVPFFDALKELQRAELTQVIKTWDGCFNIRKKRGASSLSLHSWGLAFDINAAWNRFGAEPTMPRAFVAVMKKAGFDWGGDWKKKDGMHFQLAKFPEQR